ncbi:MAG: GAF domain-containing protein [Dehalococcoidales bacterium]
MRFLANLTLGKKITFLTILGLILGIGVFSFLGIRAVNQATEAVLQDRLTTAQLMADYIDEALGRALTELKNTAQSIDSDRSIAYIESQVEALKETYSRSSIYTHGIYLLNEQGQIIWSQPMVTGVDNINISVYPSVSQAIKRDKVSISGLVLAPVTNDPVVFLTSPIQGDQQGSKGVLVVAIDFTQSYIGGFIQPVRLGQTGYIEIVDQNGTIVARTEPGPQLVPFEKSSHGGHFSVLINQGEPASRRCHTCHQPVEKVERRDIAAFVPLSMAKWGVMVRQSEEEALAPINELRQSLLLFGAGLVAIVFLFVFITTRDVVSRIRMLTTASRRIAEGDLTSPVHASGKDEVGILADTFDTMRTKLKTSHGELEQRTKELSSLLSVSAILTSLPDLSNLDTALGSALDKTLEIMKVNTGGILLLDEERQELCYRVHHGLSDDYVQGMCCPLGEGIAGRVAQTGKAILAEDISTDPRTVYPDLINAEGLRALVSVPLRSKDKVLGVLNIASHEARKFSTEDMRLLEGIAGQIATAIENANLHREVQRKEEIRGELLQDILSIQEEERRRIARELHDETSQVLASLTASLEAAAGMLPARASKIKAILRKAQALSINILDEIHRLIYELRPTLLDDLGLVAATRWLAENNLEAAGIEVDFKVTGRETRLPPQVEVTLFRVIQEAVYNIARHAQAKNAIISLHFKKKVIRVRVRDDGRGFNVEEAISSKDRPRGLGLLGMKERVELINGTLNIRSRPEGSGTEINIEIPLN